MVIGAHIFGVGRTSTVSVLRPKRYFDRCTLLRLRSKLYFDLFLRNSSRPIRNANHFSNFRKKRAEVELQKGTKCGHI